jgi:uncharacterized tellurite resistance protein B-like protein
MPIILLIVSSLAFWALYWFVQMGGIEHFQQRKKQREDDAKRVAAKEASRTAPLRAIDDPRDAAAVLMLLIARQNGDPTREQIALIEDKLRSVFGFERELAERMTQARFIARQAIDFEQAAGVFATLFKKELTADERCQLIDMLDEVARLEKPSEGQIDAIAAFRPKIGLAAAA